MKRILYLIIILLSCSTKIAAETSVYFQNNTTSIFSVQTVQYGTHILSANEWSATATSITAWERGVELLETNRNAGIHNGDDFYFDMTLVEGTDTLVLQLKLTGTFLNSDMWFSAKGASFAHPWYDDNSFHQATFAWGSKTYTLKYHAYFTGGFDDIYFALQEHEPYPILAADTTNPDVLNILAYNIYMLTPPVASTDQADRAAALPPHIKGYDAIIFSEAFYNSARTTLKNGMINEYPYQTPVVDNGILNDDGGVFIASRFPIDTFAQIVYDDCNGSDCLAAKGAMYAKINKYGRVFHLFGTHTQAWNTASDVATRILQFQQLESFVTSLNIPTSEAIIIGGDLNVDMVVNNLGEYDGMLDSLNLMEPTYSGHPYSYDGAISVYASPGIEFLDYVMTKKSHVSPTLADNKVLILRSIDDDMFNEFDLSDHLAVHGRFEFSSITNQDILQGIVDDLSLLVFPNPSSGVFQIQLNTRTDFRLSIVNMLGQLEYQSSYDDSENVSLQLECLSKGIYFVQLKAKSGEILTQKIVIQ